MISETVDRSPLVECGVAARTMDGEPASGDVPVVKEFPGGILLAAIDGLGHGLQAAGAALLAAVTLRDHAGEHVERLTQRSHERLKGSRGVAMSLASINVLTETMTWLSVGNVETILFCLHNDARPSRQSIVLRGGVVGHKLPPLHSSSLTVSAGDTVIFATDGITSSFTRDLNPAGPPQLIADRIMAGHRRTNDDALLIVARYLGAGS